MVYLKAHLRNSYEAERYIKGALILYRGYALGALPLDIVFEIRNLAVWDFIPVREESRLGQMHLKLAAKFQ